MKMLPCPFCEGPPCVNAFLRSGTIFYRRKQYPGDGLDLHAYVWCHECGAQGPHADDFACSDSDVDALRRKATELWNRRDARHRSMGKPPRKARAPREVEPLAPFDATLRHPVADTARYLKTSRPTVYKLINQGLLEAFKEGRRTYITGRSIAARSLPPAA